MTKTSDNDIAIVGMAIRVPGASTPEQFWKNLTGGVEATKHYSDEELLARGVSRSTLADANYVKAGITLQDMDAFDPEFFGFSQKEAAILDPQHRQFYEVCWEALEGAGHPPERFEGAIGLFAGCGMGAYFTFNLLSNPELVDSVGLFLLRHTGNDKDFLSTRVSYAFNLNGPCVNVQTACSTSLVATHLAVQSLLSGECDMALAGGVTIELPHGVGYHFKEGEVLSPDGHCRTFDHRSKGTVFGSGAGVVVLRRLEDALRDGDHVHAVIKGSAINNDGSRKVGYLAPSVDGQAACVTEALAISGCDADTIGYTECHGTATPVGDPIEIAALTQAFRTSSTRTGYCRVGSVKTNIGHLDTAAGVASLIKAALALEHGQIPPSLNFEAPNPTIDFESSPFKVAAELTEWRSDGAPRRAGVNSLGVGGTNAFVVLEEAPRRPKIAPDASAQLLAFSARSKKALDDYTKRFATWLRDHPSTPLADIAYSLHVGRVSFEHRRVLACQSSEEAITLLEGHDAKRVFNHSKELDRPSLVFMFPGGGAQYVRMGAGLYEAEPVFRDHIDRGLAILDKRFGVDLAPLMLAKSVEPALTEALARPSAQLPLTFLVEYALTQLLEAYGVRPDALIGHSMGENTAACVAGVISFEDALGLLLLRGQLVEQTPPGSMVSVPMAAAELKPLLGDELDLASANSPLLSVMSGALAPLDMLTARLKEQGVDVQRVRVDVAGHSRLLEGILPRFREYLRSIKLNEPKVRIVSNLTGEWLTPARARDPEYWVQHFRNSILFSEGVETLLESDGHVFLEVGPGTMLSTFVRQHSRSPMHRVLPAMRHAQDTTADHVHFRAALGRLWAVGVDFDAARMWGTERRRVPLPTYAFQHGRYWIEPGVGVSPHGRDDAERPLRLPDPHDWLRQPRWVQQGVLESSEEARTWVAFHGRESFSQTLIARLREAGHRVISVLPGDAFAQIDADTYTLAAEAGGVGYLEVFESLAERAILPDRILHDWLVTLDRTFRPGSTFFHRNQEHGFYSLFHIARALGKVGFADRPVHLTVVANGAQRLGNESSLFPDKATVLGPCAVIPREFPNLTCAFVDVHFGARRGKGKREVEFVTELQRVALDVTDELFARAGSRVVAWRDGVRWERHIGAFKPPLAAPPASRMRRGGVYLLTGGLGGIGGVIADWLAREFHARLVLVGRTPLPQRSDWDEWLETHEANETNARSIRKIQQLEALGATVLALAADVAVAERMREVVAEVRAAFGEVNGVFHLAGVIRDSLIQLKSPRDIEDVFSAKVYGTLVLDEVFRDSALDFMVLFSSLSAFVAPAGQMDYVGANAFVNAFADSCRDQRGYPVTAISWGIWREVGMVGQLAERADGARGQALPVNCPLFEQRVSSREGLQRREQIDGCLTTDDWVIDEHRLAGGEALLPGTGYVELIRSALAELGDVGPWQISDLVFESPLFVSDGARRPFQVSLSGDERRWDVEISAGLELGTFVRCATAHVTRLKVGAPAPIRRQGLEARCTVSTSAAVGVGSLRTTQEAHLQFGPRWRSLKRLDLGSGEGLAHLVLPPEHAADLASNGLHPALLDIATGCAMDLIPGYSDTDVEQALWAPISYRALRFHAPLEAELWSWIRLVSTGSATSDFAAFDVTLFDARGRVLVDVERLTLRRLEGRWQAPAAEQRSSTSAIGERSPSRAKTLTAGELALRHNVSQGVSPAEGVQVLADLLEGPMPTQLIVSSMPVDRLVAQAEALTRASMSSSDTRFARPELESEFSPPRDALEKGLAELWGKLLGVEGVGIQDSFFDLGGHSLIAVRLFNEIAAKFAADLPISVLMQSPTIESLATLIRGSEYDGAANGADHGAPRESGASSAHPRLRYRHVVPMHAAPVAGRTPLFLVAGMFGNVLNLSHLANLLGEDRPFYALQARGLYGDAAPHESFEEAARDYLEEVVQVQPQGPYMLGGFSGGGLIAFEMARQLQARGEKVLIVVMLDTPARQVPRFSWRDRVDMAIQGARREGVAIIKQKIATRLKWEKERRQLRARRGEESKEETDAPRLQSIRIGDAFLRGLATYRIPIVSVKVVVFRPKLSVKFRLSGGRLVDPERNYVREDNFWTPYVRDLQVLEVPGNHDNMVLEPNVRVLVALLRRAISGVESEHRI